MYECEIQPNLQKIMKKLFKKDPKTRERIIKKIKEVISSYDVEHYKNLKYNLKNMKRVHVGHFVLVFNYEDIQNLILFVDFDHHDNIYVKKF